MKKEIFNDYKAYKHEAKILTTSDSIKNRFDIVLKEYERIKPFIEKDDKRLFDTEQKRTLFFRQKGICTECGKPMKFDVSSAHHGIAHSSGGSSSDLESARLLHERCHRTLEKRLEKQKLF
jgi:5-methylcytosine-specific restriction endonuclease McrA